MTAIEESERLVVELEKPFHLGGIFAAGNGGYTTGVLGYTRIIMGLKALISECVSLRKDAERYRWIQDGHGYALEEWGLMDNDNGNMDKRIDEWITEDLAKKK